MRERIRAGHNHNFSHPDESSGQFIDPRTLSKAVDAILPADRVVASDPGHFCGWVPRYLRVPNARASCLSHSFQSVGLGLASTVGLAIANPGKLAVLGAGDGGFLMSISDLETAIRLGLRMWPRHNEAFEHPISNPAACNPTFSAWSRLISAWVQTYIV
jgi:thiamine pyrophosphate-dependent acetolactate synthase large subunit-like protein